MKNRLAEDKSRCSLNQNSTVYVAYTVDGAVKIHPLAADLDIRLIDMPLPGHATLAPVEMLQQ